MEMKNRITIKNLLEIYMKNFGKVFHGFVLIVHLSYPIEVDNIAKEAHKQVIIIVISQPNDLYSPEEKGLNINIRDYFEYGDGDEPDPGSGSVSA